ncbi:unnamed protein product [Gulo gulo]|uniref:Uncharacterized protein n=1 Tax=Gulo gulo TaxID=48420 RepID=A0A9X9PZ13_GULGU|nr:unnamed protein product [Gulo gulo]
MRRKWCLLAGLIFQAGDLCLQNRKETLLGQGEGCPTLSQMTKLIMLGQGCQIKGIPSQFKKDMRS